MTSDSTTAVPGTQDASDLLPKGERVSLDDGLEAVVFPLAFVQIRGAKKAITAILAAAGEAQVRKGADELEIGAAIAAAVFPVLLDEGYGLVDSNVRLGRFAEGGWKPDTEAKLEDVAHWHLGAVVEKWWDLNFGTPEKVRPWVSLIGKVVGQMTGKPFSLSGWLSQRSSRRRGSV